MGFNHPRHIAQEIPIHTRSRVRAQKAPENPIELRLFVERMKRWDVDASTFP